MAIPKRSENLFQDILEDEFIQIFKPIHILQKCLGFQRVNMKYNFVTSVSTLSQLYAAAVIFANIISIVDMVINCDTDMKTKYTDEILKICLVFNSAITDIAIWRNKFVNGNLNSMIYVKLLKLDRQLNMNNRTALNRKLAISSLCVTILIIFFSILWIIVFNFVTLKRFYPSTIFAIVPSLGNLMEMVLCVQLLLFLVVRVHFVNKLLQTAIKKKSVTVFNKSYSWSRSNIKVDPSYRIDVVLVMHNILEIVTDFINLFQFHIFGFICQFVCWDFTTMRIFVTSIKEQIPINMDMIICNIPIYVVMVTAIIAVSLVGGLLSRKLEKSRKLCINMTSYCEGKTRESAKQILLLMIPNKEDISIYDIFYLNSRLPLQLFIITANYAIVFLQFAML